MEVRDIARSLEVADRMNCMAKKEAFITLKDHKENFASNLPCRLINPAKSEMGKISKRILDDILTNVKQKTSVNLWKNTAAVTNWFSRINRKQDCTFICFDIVDFYLSISEDLLNRALDFAGKYTEISSMDKEIILNARKSMLFGQEKEWIKKGTGLFDVTMGCFDGAEICELVGAFALSELSKAIPDGNIGLYRDDGLGVLWDTPGNRADRIRKEIIKVFKNLGLNITIQINLKVVDFLDVSLNLSTESFYPYRKPNDRPMYIHRQSNHPPNIIKNIPSSISRRLTDISLNSAAFEDARQLYDNALRESEFSEQVEFLESRKINSKNVRRKNRTRNITWFNPPFSQNFATTVGRKFRSLVGKHFPKNSGLHQIFNENTLKVSYSCMPNMAAVIRQHNKATINNVSKPPTFPGCHTTDSKRCNCRTKGNCPMDGNCQVQSVVYRATVETADCRRDYTGLTALTFKERFNGHQNSMRHRSHRNSTGRPFEVRLVSEGQKH